ncbi:hypothetical protein J8Y17_28235 (plasmid) [Bacillus cereus]|uniref:hypothetical protein n=1 Tax=Bacillus cereus TaxID=1396 RepID=UPI001B8AD330|nr:hypothetical protein [Bacillus cereus]QUW34583.1 hypothetical protein J8Y17_28235 [Bacillus cereus]
MKYFEFDKYEYYALVATDGDIDKAIEIYAENVAGESVEQLKEDEGLPTEIERKQALQQYINATAEVSPVTKVSEIVKDFNEHENSVLLICGSLT